MRQKVLTEHERHLLKVFLTEGIKQNGFSVLLSRMSKHIDYLKDDLELMSKVLERLDIEEGGDIFGR